VQQEFILCAAAFFALKWSNMTDFKWKSGKLVSLSYAIMSNFHYVDLHSCTYRVLYLLYLVTDFELVGRRYGLFLRATAVPAGTAESAY